LSRPAYLERLLDDMVRQGTLGVDYSEAKAAIDFLTREGDAATLMEAAYRFCIHEPGVDVVLMGTGEREHLRANVESALKPPLPTDALERVEAVFGAVDSVTGN
jgi:aryl-alcohol dehydrogenase-like predicted oxidoreductase